ncbi:MAG TPA: RDD family protein [Acidimicrobiales bacterium]|nr:RDD family protein [Acidimicrobiales bacterium]
MNDRRGIVTPEGVLLEFDEAGIGSRTLAMTLDLTVQFIALFTLLFMLGLAAGSSSIPESVAIIIVVTAVLAVLIGYPVVMETVTRGRTLGKMALGLRVVTVEGAPVQFRHGFIRGTLGLVDFWVPLPVGVVAMWMVLVTRRSQRLGDLVAGTIVVRERQATTDMSSFSFPPPQGCEGYVASLDVATLGDERYALIRSFLLRVWDFSPDARYATSVKLATGVAAHLHHTPPQIHPELFLASVAAAYQARQRVM